MNVQYAAETLHKSYMSETDLTEKEVSQLRQESKRTIIGIDNVTDPKSFDELSDRRKSDRKANQDTYAADARELFNKLDHAGIEYKQMMPLVAWNLLVKKAGLLTLEPDEKSRVKIAIPVERKELQDYVEDREVITRIRAFFGSCASAIAVGICTGTALGGIEYQAGANFETGGPVIAIGMAALLGSFIGFIQARKRLLQDFDTPQISDGNFSGAGRRKAEARLLRKILADEKDAKNKLFPNLTEAKDGVKIGIRLPEAPEDVRNTLLKADRARIKMYVRAVPEAVSFTDDPVDVITNHRQGVYDETDRRNEERRIQRESMKFDPIIEARHGKAVAVIAQYGNFPIEKALIDQVADQDVRFLA